MAKKGQKFEKYSQEKKTIAVQMYLNGEGSYETISKNVGLRSSTQLKAWVKKFNEEGENLKGFTDNRGGKGVPNPLKGRRVHFNSVEEERDYYKAQVEYLKKRYPNL